MEYRTLAKNVGRFLIERVLIWVGFGLVLYFVHTQIGRLPLDKLHITPDLLALSVLLLICAYLLNGIRLTLTLQQTTPSLDMRTGLALFFSYQLSTYVPGGIWQFLHIGYRGDQEGLPKSETSFNALQYEGVTLGAAITVFAALPLSSYLPITVVGALLVSAAILLIWVLPLQQVAHTAARITGLELSDTIGSNAALSTFFLLSVASWILAGTGFFLLVNAILPGVSLPLPAAISAYAGGWAAGFIVFLVPGGLGVREGTLIYLLGTFIGVQSALLIAVAARIWATIPQLLFGGWILLRSETKSLETR